MKETIDLGRRRILLTGGLAAAALTLGRTVSAADGGQRLSPDDPQAKALGYVEDAANVDPAEWPKFADPSGQHCANCALYQGGSADWGGCGIFPGKQVAAAGWCNAWVPAG